MSRLFQVDELQCLDVIATNGQSHEDPAAKARSSQAAGARVAFTAERLAHGFEDLASLHAPEGGGEGVMTRIATTAELGARSVEGRTDGQGGLLTC